MCVRESARYTVYIHTYANEDGKKGERCVCVCAKLAGGGA